MEGLQEFTREVYAKLTALRTETVEVTVYRCKKCGYFYDSEVEVCDFLDVDDCECGGKDFLEFKAIDQLPIPDPPEWEGRIIGLGYDEDIGKHQLMIELSGDHSHSKCPYTGTKVVVTLVEEQ